jgi:dienelactone hydrolase
LVKVWGVIGFSMGGHSTFMAAASGKRNKWKVVTLNNSINAYM